MYLCISPFAGIKKSYFMPISDFRGLGVALITPFKEDFSVDYEALSQLIKYHLSSGTDYIVALGTTAETPTLTRKEKDEIVRFIVKEVNGKIPIVAGIGDNNTAALVEEIRSFDLTGISAILSVTPYYNKPTQEGLFRHYCALSGVSPVPVILYNVPGRTGVNMTAGTTIRIANHCGNVIAIKEASADLKQIDEIVRGAPDGFKVISGDDSVTTSVIELGGIGVISVFGNAFPKDMGRLVNSVLNGNFVDARHEMEEEYGELSRLIFLEGNPAGVKSILYQLGKIKNILRLPLLPVSENTHMLIKSALEKISVL